MITNQVSDYFKADVSSMEHMECVWSLGPHTHASWRPGEGGPGDSRLTGLTSSSHVLAGPDGLKAHEGDLHGQHQSHDVEGAESWRRKRGRNTHTVLELKDHQTKLTHQQLPNQTQINYCLSLQNQAKSKHLISRHSERNCVPPRAWGDTEGLICKCGWIN